MKFINKFLSVTTLFLCCLFSNNTIAQTDTVNTFQSKYLLDEVNVIGFKPSKILKKAIKNLAKHPKTQNYCHYGQSQYTKITECNKHTVEYRNEYGYFFTTGNTQQKDKWDLNYKFAFIPLYTARSYNLTPNGKDTLSPITMQSSNITYDAGTQKIFTLIRAILSSGPLFMPKCYDYNFIDQNESNLRFSFRTLENKFPNKTRIYCRGILTISKTGFLQHIQIDHIDYNLFSLTNLKQANSPFSTSVEINIGYDRQSYPYVTSCIQTTTWKHNPNNQYIAIEKPSRRNPTKNNLVETEAYKVENYIPLKFIDNHLDRILQYAVLNPSGIYDPQIFHLLPVLIPSSKAFTELSQYMDIIKQFQIHSNKPYYPASHILQFTHHTKDAQFLYNIQYSKLKLFELLNINK